jgi:hypothetical protein
MSIIEQVLRDIPAGVLTPATLAVYAARRSVKERLAAFSLPRAASR